MCEHKRLRCTDGVFYCLDCGAKVDTPTPVKTATGAAEATTEAAEQPKKRRTRKKGE